MYSFLKKERKFSVLKRALVDVLACGEPDTEAKLVIKEAIKKLGCKKYRQRLMTLEINFQREEQDRHQDRHQKQIKTGCVL